MVEEMKIGDGYKKTEVGVIPEDWEVKKLDSVGEILSSKRIFVSDYVEAGIPFYRGKEIKEINKGLKISDLLYIDKDKYNFIKKRFGIPRTGDILISAVGSLGNIYRVPNNKPFYFKDGNLIWVKNIKVSSILLKYLLNYFHKQILDTAIGSSQKALTIIRVSHVQLPIPPLKEQKAIATALSDVDNLIESTQKLIDKKKKIKIGTMQELLTGKKRLDGFSGEWEEKKLGDIVDFYKGKGLSKSEISIEGKYKCIHYGELFTLYKEKIKLIFNKTDNIKNKFLSKRNDVLMPTSDVTPNGLAKASCILESGIILGGDILVIRENEKVIDGVFLSNVIRNDKSQIMQLVSGTTVYHLYASDMQNFKFKLPPLKEQQAIAQILSDMDSEIELLEEKLQKYKTIKKGMMQELLTGRIRLI